MLRTTGVVVITVRHNRHLLNLYGIHCNRNPSLSRIHDVASATAGKNIRLKERLQNRNMLKRQKCKTQQQGKINIKQQQIFKK